MSSTLRIGVIVGSTRPQRFSDKPANWIYQIASKNKSLVVELLDLRDYPMPFFNESISPSYMQGDYDNKTVKQWGAKIKDQDAYIIVMPEYNHGPSAVLKNALDYVYSAWNNKPVGFVSYGSVGGARSVEQLRLVAIELQMAPIRSSIHIQQYWNLLDEKGSLKPGALDQYAPAAEKFVDQLVWWAQALKTARKNN